MTANVINNNREQTHTTETITKGEGMTESHHEETDILHLEDQDNKEHRMNIARENHNTDATIHKLEMTAHEETKNMEGQEVLIHRLTVEIAVGLTNSEDVLQDITSQKYQTLLQNPTTTYQHENSYTIF